MILIKKNAPLEEKNTVHAEHTYNHLHLRLLIVRDRNWTAGYVSWIIALSSGRAGTVVAPNGVGAGIVNARTMLGRGITLIDVCGTSTSLAR